MTDEIRWFAGLDCGREQHRACLLDGKGKCVAERSVAHEGNELVALCAWLIKTTGAQPGEIAVAIETPRGPVVEVLLERGFAVFSLNPKQLDRFRDASPLRAPRTTAAMLMCSRTRCVPIGLPFAG